MPPTHLVAILPLASTATVAPLVIANIVNIRTRA